MTENTTAAEIRVPLTRRQAEFLVDLYMSGSESYAEALAAGARIEGAPSGSEVLVIPPAASSAVGLAVGIRADLADEAENGWDIGERRTVLGLARKLANAGVTGAAPLTPQDVFGKGQA